MRPTRPSLLSHPALYACLFLFLLACYLLSYTPRINSSDGLAMFATAESLVRRGAVDIEQVRWMGLQQGTYGQDGLLYSRKGIGLPLALLPLTGLGLVVPWLGTVGVSLLFNALVTALTAVLLLAYLQRLGFSPATGLVVALTFGLATLAWPYAKSLFSDPFSGLLLLAAAYALLRAGPGRAGLQAALLAGLWLGWNVATRYAELLFVPVYGLLLLYYLAHRDKHPLRSARFWLPVGAFGAPLLLTGLGLIAFNLFRYGSPFNTGYLPTETFSANLWQGVAGQLISPGRGLFLYCPILLLSLAGMPLLWQRRRAEALLALGVILIHLLLYGKWFMWHGGYAWGPRFMLPTLPFWAIFLAPVVERAGRSRPLRSAFVALAALSLIPQLLAVSIDFSPFQGYLLESGLPLFAPETFFRPQHSPLLGAWAFISRDTLDLAWAWQGQFNGWLLALLLLNLGLSGLALKRQVDPAPGGQRWLLAALPVSLAALLYLAAYTHTLPPPPLQEAVAALNRGVRPTDAVINNQPQATMPLAELYQGYAPVLGLNSGGPPLPDDIERRLAQTIKSHQQIWWLPGSLPARHSAVEQLLLATGFRARNDTFGSGEQRLALFAYPDDLAAAPLPERPQFGPAILLAGAAYPPQVGPGTALPLELTWQALAPIEADYHVFVHLVTAEGQVVAQADGQPVYWTRPTSTWQPGQLITDRYGLWLPPHTEPGRYQLRVGLYDPPTGQRLPLPTGADHLELAIEISGR